MKANSPDGSSSAVQGQKDANVEKNLSSPLSTLSSSTLWIGGEGGMEADLVKRAGVPFAAIPAAGLHGVGLKALPANLARLGRGARQARQILRRFKPDVLFFTGGFVAGPVAVAARSLGSRRIPIVLYVPDIEPGLALKFLARFADRIAVTAPASQAFFARPERVTVTGYPTRPDLSAWDRDRARQALQLVEDLPTLLVFGGSKGSRSINQALWGVLPELLGEAQIVHVTGQLDWPAVAEVQSRLEPELNERYHVYPYLHAELGAAFSVADLVISRAGASCLGEFPLFGLPAVLVPYPYAWRYQQVNAQYLAQRGAAVVVQDADLADQILPLARAILSDASRREAMHRAMRSLARPDASGAIAALLQAEEKV
jgi:UDP-N-acetylglucosamine--N-acetylmuramyl-(pentapeptide) pyrophosphoryl-undecaprenol N-acetylglucosamine transferase